ncbi:MAG: type II toxin-antitoxin system VapC family toxin [Armatimonadetes bacterium]|nr:type II toxin-antitoxin system VapC family toxin [Armatimonadota bacterium]
MQKYILDTNIFNALFHNDTNAAAIRTHIAAQPTGSIFLCTVTIEEALRGVYAQIHDDETRKRAGDGHALLPIIVKELAKYSFLPYDDAGNALFLAFPAAVRCVGAADCKIAAVVQVNSAVVVTRNTKHFASIPATRHEDWTQAVSP